jgi:hypothetical protein
MNPPDFACQNAVLGNLPEIEIYKKPKPISGLRFYKGDGVIDQRFENE